MSWGMEILSPAESYLSGSSWLYEGDSTKWTPIENKLFENALALFDKDTPDRWQKVAAMVPGKTVVDVMRQYKELVDDVSSIEAGLIPIPGYRSSPFTLKWGNSHDDHEGLKQAYAVTGKRSSSARTPEQERKKGIPWTEEEHKLFLMGLKKYGKGDWRNISRNYVITRTPTQVASHAQKYFIRQLSVGKDKRRASIHDITTVNFEDIPNLLTDGQGQQSTGSVHGMPFQRNQSNSGAAIAFNQTCGRMFTSYMMDPFGLQTKSENLLLSASDLLTKDFAVQMQAATRHYPHGLDDIAM